MPNIDIKNEIKNTIQLEYIALRTLEEQLDYDNITHIINILNTRGGDIFFTGVGKSGFIAKKGASLFTSLGIRAFFIDPCNASHGDLGVLQNHDVILLISYSGETIELHHIVHYCKTHHIEIISIGHNTQSYLGKVADYFISVPRLDEAYLRAPTVSFIMMTSVIDTIAVTLSKLKMFHVEHYSKIHPSGKIGLDTTPIRDKVIHDESFFVHTGMKVYEIMKIMLQNKVHNICVVGVDDVNGLEDNGNNSDDSGGRRKFIGYLSYQQLCTQPNKFDFLVEDLMLDYISNYQCMLPNPQTVSESASISYTKNKMIESGLDLMFVNTDAIDGRCNYGGVVLLSSLS